MTVFTNSTMVGRAVIKKCAVRSCGASSTAGRFKSAFRLPVNDNKRLDAFMEFLDDPSLKLLPLEELAKLNVCEIHFEPCFILRYQRFARLSNAAIPTLNRPPPSGTSSMFKISATPTSSQVVTSQAPLIQNPESCSTTLPMYTITVARDIKSTPKRFDLSSMQIRKPITPVMNAQESATAHVMDAKEFATAPVIAAQERSKAPARAVQERSKAPFMDAQAIAIVPVMTAQESAVVPVMDAKEYATAPVMAAQESAITPVMDAQDSAIALVLNSQGSKIGPKDNEVVAHFKFFKRAQLPTETFNHWYSDLKHLVSFCNFGDLESKLLRTQIVLGIHNTEIQEKLLRTDLSLETTILTIRAFEASEKCR